MNATLFILSSALTVGGDVTPAGWGESPPAVVQAGGCCGNAYGPTVSGSCCDPCANSSRGGLLSRLKGRFGGKGGSCCTPAPTCCAPTPACCAPAPSCNTCGTYVTYSQPNLLDRLRAGRLGKHHKGSSCCDSCGAAVAVTGVPGCATPLPPGAAPVVPTSPENPPKEMPKPKDTKTPGSDTKPVEPKKTSGAGVSIPPAPSAVPTAPEPITLPPLPAAPPVSAPKQTGGTSPY